jgi:hypothetical protein
MKDNWLGRREDEADGWAHYWKCGWIDEWRGWLMEEWLNGFLDGRCQFEGRGGGMVRQMDVPVRWWSSWPIDEDKDKGWNNSWMGWEGRREMVEIMNSYIWVDIEGWVTLWLDSGENGQSILRSEKLVRWDCTIRPNCELREEKYALNCALAASRTEIREGLSVWGRIAAVNLACSSRSQ